MRVWIIVAACLLSSALQGASPPAAVNQSFKEAIKVKGQTRNVKMNLVVKTKEDSIRFIHIRKNFKPEILKTQY